MEALAEYAGTQVKPDQSSQAEVSQEVRERERQLKMMRQVTRELLYKDGDTNESRPISKHEFLSSSSEDEGGETQMLEEGADSQRMLRGFKNLMCPLCLNVMYKCTTAACGHSFCERCLDEYLIIKKVGAVL